MLGERKGKFVKQLFWSYFLLISILLLCFSIVFYRQWRNGQQKNREQEFHNQTTLLARIIDEKFSDIELAASQTASSEWLKYVSAKSDILYNKVNYQKRLEICGMIGNQNDSLRIAKSMAVLLSYRNLAVDKVSFWDI